MDAIKGWGLSPDGCVQAALQLAFHRVQGYTPSTYESSSTAHFAAGRTETIRSASDESAAFVAAAIAGAPRSEQLTKLRASAQRHSELAREASAGHGVDRHLYALRRLHASRGGSASCDTAGNVAGEGGDSAASAFFDDPTLTTLTSNELSTSTLTSNFARQASFGPVHPDGFGVSYHLPKRELRFCVTTYKPRSAAAFKDALDMALTSIAELCESRG